MLLSWLNKLFTPNITRDKQNQEEEEKNNTLLDKKSEEIKKNENSKECFMEIKLKEDNKEKNFNEKMEAFNKKLFGDPNFLNNIHFGFDDNECNINNINNNVSNDLNHLYDDIKSGQ